MTEREARESITGAVKEEVRELKFRCPECGHEKLDYREAVLNEVTSVTSDGEFELGDERHDEILGYSCQQCGYVLEDDDEPVIRRWHLAAWLTANCDQER